MKVLFYDIYNLSITVIYLRVHQSLLYFTFQSFDMVPFSHCGSQSEGWRVRALAYHDSGEEGASFCHVMEPTKVYKRTPHNYGRKIFCLSSDISYLSICMY